MREQVERLRAAITEGLGAHHNLSGTCNVQFREAPECDFALVLSPGEVGFEAALAAQPKAVAAFAPGGLAALLEHGPHTDIRAPEVSQWLSASGDSEWVANAVLLSVQRPPAGAHAMFQQIENRARLSPGFSRLRALERVSGASLDDLVRRANAGLPFIVEDALDAWPALREPIDAFVARHAQALLPPLAGEGRETLGAFARRARARTGSRCYTLGVGLPPEMAHEFPTPFGIGQHATAPQLWFGAGADASVPVTPLHRDSMCGLLGHVYGRKRFVIFPPHQSDAVYARSSYHFFQTCWAAPHRPDPARYPKLKDATPVEFVLEPGELLVQPAGWFHSVYSLDEMTMSVSYFI